MTEEERDGTRLEVIALLIQRIENRLAKTEAVAFLEDPDEIDLLAYRLAMIGEEANKLSASLKARFSEMPWTDMYRLRNIVAHQYHMVTPERIWATATSGLGPLKAIVRTALCEIGE